MSDTQPVNVRPRPPLEALSFDVTSCHRVEFCIAMQEHERGKPGLSCHAMTWPEEPRRLIERELATWTKLHPDAIPEAFTTAIASGCCVGVLHYRNKPQ